MRRNRFLSKRSFASKLIGIKRMKEKIGKDTRIHVHITTITLCKHCIYFVLSEDEKIQHEGYGECRKNAPVLQSTSIADIQQQIVLSHGGPIIFGLGSWPVIHNTKGCGEGLTPGMVANAKWNDIIGNGEKKSESGETDKTPKTDNKPPVSEPPPPPTPAPEPTAPTTPTEPPPPEPAENSDDFDHLADLKNRVTSNGVFNELKGNERLKALIKMIYAGKAGRRPKIFLNQLIEWNSKKPNIIEKICMKAVELHMGTEDETQEAFKD